MPEYIAGLCVMDGTELVPVESLSITASDDDEAVRKAIEWRVATLTTVDRKTWLQVLRDGAAIYSKAYGRV
jgi:hypothetical protein